MPFGNRILLIFLLGCTSLVGKASAADSKFLRFVETGPREGHVDTAITSYRLPNGVEVALIAALHIGDEKYYHVLNRRFKQYDGVLYEMIKERSVDPAAVGGSGHRIPRATQERTRLSPGTPWSARIQPRLMLTAAATHASHGHTPRNHL